MEMDCLPKKWPINFDSPDNREREKLDVCLQTDLNLIISKADKASFCHFTAIPITLSCIRKQIKRVFSWLRSVPEPPQLLVKKVVIFRDMI